MKHIPDIRCPCYKCERRSAECHPWRYDYFLYTVLMDAKRELFREYATENGIYNKKSEAHIRACLHASKKEKERRTR